MEFCIQVLRINNRKPLPKALRESLKSNETRYLRRDDVWLFEGDWEWTFSEFIDEGISFKCLGEVILETLNNEEVSDDELHEQIEYLLRD